MIQSERKLTRRMPKRYHLYPLAMEITTQSYKHSHRPLMEHTCPAWITPQSSLAAIQTPQTRDSLSTSAPWEKTRPAADFPQQSARSHCGVNGNAGLKVQHVNKYLYAIWRSNSTRAPSCVLERNTQQQSIKKRYYRKITPFCHRGRFCLHRLGSKDINHW